jgi:hypothetical protein
MISRFSKRKTISAANFQLNIALLPHHIHQQQRNLLTLLCVKLSIQVPVLIISHFLILRASQILPVNFLLSQNAELFESLLSATGQQASPFPLCYYSYILTALVECKQGPEKACIGSMADYPNASAYGVNYGAQDQTHPPYVPPAYPAQYMQPADGRMGSGMSSAYEYTNPVYTYNGPGSFSASAIASGVPPLPIFQGWNQNQAPLPVYNAHAGQQYMNYSDQNAQHSQHNSQYYVPANTPVYQPVSQPPPVYDEGEVSENEFDSRRRQLNNPITSYGGTQYPANDRTAYIDSAQQGRHSAPSEQQNQQKSFVTGKRTSYRINYGEICH